MSLCSSFLVNTNFTVYVHAHAYATFIIIYIYCCRVPGGPGGEYLTDPRGLAYDGSTGLLYITVFEVESDRNGDDSHWIPKIAVMDPVTDLIVRKIEIGGRGGDGEHFTFDGTPEGIALDAFGNVLVANSWKNWVAVFNASDGTLLSRFPTPPSPCSVFVDAKGNVLVGGEGYLCMW